MYPDHSLMPKEAVRLSALAHLAEREMSYRDLATAVRHFIDRIMGPSLDLMGNSLELLIYEGLVEAVDGKGMADNAVLRLTPPGATALEALLKARLRGSLGDVNRLTLLLKLRFLRHLPEAEQQAQLSLIAQSLQEELARVEDLRRHHADAPGPFLDWLDQDIAALTARLSRLPAP